MAWIEFHGARIKRLKKFRDLRMTLNWSVNETLGFLGSFWGEVIELRENGDITDWTSEYLCELTNVSLSPGRVWEALVTFDWIEEREDGKILIHDWLDSAGKYLTRKYNTSNKEKLIEIWALHQKKYGSEQLENEKRPKRELTLPNLIIPNQTINGVGVGASADHQPEPVALLSNDKGKDAVKAEHLVALWNENAHVNMPRVRILSESVGRAANARLVEHPDVDFWQKIIEKMNASPLCRGEARNKNGSKPWRASFEWMVNPTNLAKIVNGNYE